MKKLIFAAALSAAVTCTVFSQDVGEEIFNSIVRIHAVIPKDARSAASLGTDREGHGVVIDAKGNILTIGYLVSEAESIELILGGGKKASATFVGYDQSTGFGIVRADAPLGLVPLKLGDSSAVKEGDPILVAGSGGSAKAQVGRVLARKEFAGYWEYLLQDALYTVPAYAEFGGAALIDRNGRLVGIGSLYTQIGVQGVGIVGANVFVPIDILKPILGGLVNFGRSPAEPKPWIGVNSEESHGRVFISRVTKDGPAEKAGLLPGDMVVSVEGRPVRGLAELYRAVWDSGPAGTEVSFKILRDDGMRDVRVKTADRNQYIRQRPRKVL